MSVEGQGSDFSGAIGEAAGSRLQCAALCFRVHHGQAQVLLVTSRDTGRWLLPKGWPIAGLDHPQSAAREAWEEAGVKGETQSQCLGQFSYLKLMSGGTGQPCIVMVYPLRVDTIAARFRERAQRRRKWFALEKAALLVQEPGAQQLIAAFARNPLAQPGTGAGKA